MDYQILTHTHTHPTHKCIHACIHTHTHLHMHTVLAGGLGFPLSNSVVNSTLGFGVLQLGLGSGGGEDATLLTAFSLESWIFFLPFHRWVKRTRGGNCPRD